MPPFPDKRIRFHDSRHTHASLVPQTGVHPKVVQERLGHSSIAVTRTHVSVLRCRKTQPFGSRPRWTSLTHLPTTRRGAQKGRVTYSHQPAKLEGDD
jgi:integrase-like protein